MRRTKIVATIGPASEDEATLEQLVAAGMDVARLNLSLSGPGELERRLAILRSVRERTRAPLGIMLDTRGPEVRVGDLPGGGVELVPGRAFTLTPTPTAGAPDRAWINYPRLAAQVQPGQRVLLDDGNLVLHVESVNGDEVRCVVEVGGWLRGGKKVNLPGLRLDLPPLVAEDLRDLELGVAGGADFVAVSFVNGADDVAFARRTLARLGGDMAVVAKIETLAGMEHFEAIVRAADGVMVARGDLGVELPVEDVPALQKELLRACRDAGKPSITATQMLESMIEHGRPTRAEASDVFNAILDGSDAVMLSAETAIGAHPVDTVQVMARIAERAEQVLPYREFLAQQAASAHATVTGAVAYATVTAAENLGAAAILTSTESGHTARMVAQCRPRAPIVACTPHPRTRTQLSLVWGVVPVTSPAPRSTDELLAIAIRSALDFGHVRPGDLVVLTAGVPVGVPGSTNLIKVERVGEVLLQGQGVPGRTQVTASGRVCLVQDAADAAERFRDGDILVAAATDPILVGLMQRAAAVITEAGGPASHAAKLGPTLGVPMVVGAMNAMRLLRDGQFVTVDGERGLVYRSAPRVP